MVDVPKICKNEILREGDDVTLRVNCEGCSLSPSIEDSGICMSKIIEILVTQPDITKLVLTQKRDYEYDYAQTQMLVEIAMIYSKIAKDKNLFGYHSLSQNSRRFTELQKVVFDLLKSDPLGAYVDLHRIMREEKIDLEKAADKQKMAQSKRYIEIINYVLTLLDGTKLINISKPYLAGYHMGERDLYRRVFNPTIKPDFMYTKIMSSYPQDGIEIDNYMVGDTEITIFKTEDNVQTLYHVIPPEFKLDEDKYELLDIARKILADHSPKKDEFVNPERMRAVFYNVGRDLLEELAEYRNLKLRSKELDNLTKVLVRYTVGFGLIEVLLQDEKVQDISINSPMGQIPIFIVHADYDDCRTNIIPTNTEAESWASKLRMISGRPLDEANPLLDTELELPGASTRVSTITRPLDPTGLAFSFRRHRDKPWTLPLYIKYKMINPLSAGLISFIVDGTRTILISGTRSSGKSSFLSSILVEIMRRYRIITIEDTLELPTTALRKLGYNIQPMKVAPALAASSNEMSASDGIRSTLRLGDSSLIVGEVRSAEAIALYEAMRVGAAANVVAGTIHGDSPYGVFDRVVNDIGVPKTSFKATDIIIVANPIKSADGLHKMRRVTQITEVRKTWENDPMLEGGFSDLFKYDAKRDELMPTDDLITGESEILKTIAGNISDFAGNWDAVWENIQLRAKIKKLQVEASEEMDDPDLLEAPFTIKCNDMFHIISSDIKEKTGKLEPEKILFKWQEWLKRELSRRKKE